MKAQECDRCGAPTWARLCRVCAGRHASGGFICCGGYGSHTEGCELVGHVRQQKFWDYVAIGTTDECWLWQRAPIVRGGYGHFMVRLPDGAWKPVRAHRLAYEMTFGPIPAGLHIDHLCSTPLCVNPKHLEAVTQAENNRRQRRPNAEKTHCVAGHPFDGDNLYVTPSTGGRVCRTCKAARRPAERARRRQREQGAA